MRLKELRESRNESQQKIAMLLNVSQTMVSRYELGQATPDIPTLILLAKHFNVSVDYIIENTDVKTPYMRSDLSKTEHLILSMLKGLSNIQLEKAEAYIQGLLQE